MISMAPSTTMGPLGRNRKRTVFIGGGFKDFGVLFPVAVLIAYSMEQAPIATKRVLMDVDDNGWAESTSWRLAGVTLLVGIVFVLVVWLVNWWSL